MANTKYSEPFTLGYYVFNLPNGQVLDMLSAELVELPDDLSKLPARYVERDVRFFGENPPQPKGRKVRVPVAPISGDELEATSQSCDRVAAALRMVVQRG